MKTVFQYLLIPALLIANVSFINAQEKSQLVNSEVSFFSEAPLENIEAHNKYAKGIIDWKTNNFSFRIPIKDFVFKKSLMQEHFNENYMESDKFPNATFKGKMDGDYNLKKSGTYQVTATGEIEIHGVKQQRTIPATIEVKGKTVTVSSSFKVELEDHEIEIPTIVFSKIAEIIEVTLKGELKEI